MPMTQMSEFSEFSEFAGDDALQTLHVIQNLQLKLRKASHEVQIHRQSAAKAEAALQSQAMRHLSQAELQQESMLSLQEAFQERDAECVYTERLISELQAFQSELLVNEQNERAFVHREQHEFLQSEFETLQDEMQTAAESNAAVARTLEEMKEAKRRRDELIIDKINETREMHWQSQRNALEAKRRGNAVSSRAVAEEQLRASRAQKSCAQLLTNQKADFEAQLDEAYRQSASIEQRMEGLRERNRQLELQMTKEKTEFEKQKKEMVQKLRKQSAAFRTFSNLLDEPWLDA